MLLEGIETICALRHIHNTMESGLLLASAEVYLLLCTWQKWTHIHIVQHT